MRAKELDAASVARSYYNSRDADNFYFHIWGGAHIHVGYYSEEGLPIRVAARRTVDKMCDKLKKAGVKDGCRIIDLGAGYGGVSRYLATRFNAQVTSLNISDVENGRNIRLNAELGMDDLVEVVESSFEKIDRPDNSYDVAWAQDSFLHGGNRLKAMSETTRVLKPGGQFLLADLMQTDECPIDALEPILKRIHLPSLGSPSYYKDAAPTVGLKLVEYEDHPDFLQTHYQRVLDDMNERRDAGHLSGLISEDFMDKMAEGLERWAQGGENGWLTWGIFHFEKDMQNES